MNTFKTFVNVGLISSRTDINWNMNNTMQNATRYIPSFASQTKAKKMELLILAGVYNINNPAVFDHLLQDFYAPGSESQTPRKVVAMIRLGKALEKQQLKNKLPIQRTQQDKMRADALKRKALKMTGTAPTRKAPKEAAKFYNVGTVVNGMNGTNWIVKASAKGTKRWVRH